MLIFDAHLDLAWNAIDWNRNLLLPVTKIRESERAMEGKGRGVNTVSFPEMQRGKVFLSIATLLARLLRPSLMPAIQRYSTMEAAYASARGQLAYYKAMEQRGIVGRITNAKELQQHLAAWERENDPTQQVLGIVISMEGADPVLGPEQVEEWWEAGLRIIGPAHYGVSPYAHGTGTEGRLFPAGRQLLKEMERVGMILDVTHLSDECLLEALELYDGPVLASHHNCRALVPNQRQLSDEQVRRLIERGAVIGAALDNWMLSPGWVRGESHPELVKLEHMLDHMDHVCQLAGNAKHAAIGTDLDGGFGKEQSPSDLDTIADLQKIPDMLRKRGYSESDVEGIMYRNWVRFFTDAWSR